MRKYSLPRGRLIIAVTLFFVLFGAALIARPSLAQTSAPAITLQPASGPPGALVIAQGRDFVPGAQVNLYLAGISTSVSARTQPQAYGAGFAGPDGRVNVPFFVPLFWPDGSPVQSGAIQVVLATADFASSATATFNVIAIVPTPTSTPTPTFTPMPAPTFTPTPVSRNPFAEVSPASGQGGAQVIVRGGGFPPNTQVAVLLGKFDGQVNASGPQAYASGVTDNAGNYELVFIMPTHWADGKPIDAGMVLVVVTTPDLTQQAAVPFRHLGSPPTATPTPTLTPTPAGPAAVVQPESGGPHTPVTIRGYGFPANTRVNAHLAGVITDLQKSGSESTIYASTVTDGAGNYIMPMVMPADWPDGTPLQSGQLAILIATDDYRTTANATFTYTALQSTPTPSLPASQASWRGHYWSNTELKGAPTFVRIDQRINFDWGYGGPATDFPTDNFSARWTSDQHFARTGRYRFTVEVDDGARLMIGNQVILDEWEDGARRTLTADVILGAGSHPLRVEYYEKSGEAVIKLKWAYMGGEPITPTPTPTPDGLLFDDAPQNNQRRDNNYFCSGFESECNYGNCPKDYRVVWALYCRETDYPYIKTGQYRVTIFGEGSARIGVTDFGHYGSLFALGEYETALPAAFEFCWAGLQSGGTGFETVVQSLGTYAEVDRIRIEHVSDRCR